MKSYLQLLESLPNKTIVFSFGKFSPPTVGHALLIQFVKKLSLKNSLDHVIYVSDSTDVKRDVLKLEQKIHYLKLLFPNTTFGSGNQLIEIVKLLNIKYKNAIMVCSSDKVLEFKKFFDKNNNKNFHFDFNALSGFL